MTEAKSRRAKFFCENCGAEVPESARFCKHCGKFFTSVRCPQCGAQGSASRFANGCPECGYAMGDSQSPLKKSMEEKKTRRASAVRASRKTRPRESRAASRNSGDAALPIWVYAVTLAGIAAACALVALYGCKK